MLPSAHVCTGTELVRSAALGITMVNGRYILGAYIPVTQSLIARDCNGLTNGGANEWGPRWLASSNLPDVRECNMAMPLLCCD